MILTTLRALQAEELVETAHNASGGMPARLSHVSAIRRPTLNWDTQSDINVDHLAAV